MQALNQKHVPINRVGIVGAGAMGRGIAQICAQAGVHVFLFDANPESAHKASQSILNILTTLADKGKLSKAGADSAFAHLHVCSSLDELADCNLVIEAIVERLEPKRELVEKLEAILPAMRSSHQTPPRCRLPRLLPARSIRSE
jgi:3-hydroxybutyryl-CoA dehydrogenase